MYREVSNISVIRLLMQYSERQSPSMYGIPSSSGIAENNGTDTICPRLDVV